MHHIYKIIKTTKPNIKTFYHFFSECFFLDASYFKIEIKKGILEESFQGYFLEKSKGNGSREIVLIVRKGHLSTLKGEMGVVNFFFFQSTLLRKVGWTCWLYSLYNILISGRYLGSNT